MREIFWRIAAVVLAAAVAWMAWPRPSKPAIAEFKLEPNCDAVMHPINGGRQLECWRNGVRVVQDNPLWSGE